MGSRDEGRIKSFSAKRKAGRGSFKESLFGVLELMLSMHEDPKALGAVMRMYDNKVWTLLDLSVTGES